MKTLHTIYTSFAKRLVMLFILLVAIGIGNGYAAQETLSGSFTSSNTTSGGFTASGGTAGKYYKLQTGYIISDNSYSVDATKSISISMKVGTFGNYSANKQSVDFYAIDKNGNIISNKVTASFSKANSDGTTFSGTIKLNSGISGNEVRFKFASNSNATSDVCARFYNFTITYESAPSTFTVTYNANGATGSVPTDANEYASGATVTAKSHGNLVKEGFSFAGWKRSDNNSIVQENATFTMPASNLTLTAQWTERQLTNYRTTCSTQATVSFDLNGGSGTFETVTLDGDSYTIPETVPTRDGYNFVGWKIQDGNETIYKHGTDNATISNITESITLVAQWSAIEYTITYNLNGGSGVSNTTYTIESGNITLPTPTPAQQGLIFAGWYESADFTGNAVTVITHGSTGNKEFWAKWEKSTPTFAWSDATCTAALEVDNTFPTLKNPNTLPVTYTSSNTDVATIDANGNITLVATGTTTITATGAETDTHKSATAIYELNVLESNCRWVEVEIGDITYGDDVLIAVHGTDATSGDAILNMLQDPHAATNPTIRTIKVIDLLNGTYVPTTVIWNIRKRDDNQDHFTIYRNGSTTARLAFVSGYDIRVGSSTSGSVDSIFTITTEGYLQSTQTSHNMRMSTSSDWRHYTTAGQTLKFYKRECLDATNYWVEGNFTNVTCDTQLPQQLAKNGSITLTFTAADGYELPNTVTVDKATKTWDKTNGKLTISNPTGNVMVTVEAVELHTITWMVGSNSVLTEEVANATGVTQTPADPANGAIGECANAFMGWTETLLGSAEGQSAPADLRTAAQMKSKHSNVTGDKTFYAVFATKEGSSETTQMYKLVTNISGGKEYIFATGNSAGSVYGLTCDANSNLTATSLTVKTSDDITYIEVPASNNVVWNITGSSSSYNAQNKGQTGKYLRCYGTSPNAVIATTAYALYWTSTNGLYGKSNSGNTSYYLYYDTSTSKWGAKSNASGRVYAFEKSEVTVDNTTYSNYVTNCCALAPATNLTVSGTTSNTATLTWTAPSPTTGITKLQVRNAADDAVVVDNIAVNTTTATITGLTECTSYQYYVVSVGEDCEVVSNIVTAQPFGNAKTVNYNYNGGSGSVASFTTSCTNQTITLPAATRTGYDFNGWYTAVTGGTCVGGAGDTYEPATSPVTLYAQWTIKSYTVTWNPNGGNWDGSTSNIVETYEYGAAIKEPADPKRENGIFKGWNPSVPSNMPAGNQTYTAQWEMVYTLTFVDMNAGGTTSTLTQTSSGQNIVAPTANSEVCDMWTFIGWAPSNSLNGGTDKPTGFIAAGETILGSQITGNNTYYSVYSYNSDNTQEFEVGKSGTYFMYAISGTTKYYATTVKTSNTAFYANTESDMSTYSSKKSTFILTYNTNTTKYVIKHINTTADKESEGYFYQADPTKKDITVNSSSSSSFEIAKGETQGSYRIKFTYTANSNTVTGNFGQSSSSFQGYAEGYDIFFEPASEIQYYNAADCGEVETYTMSFHNPFGDENALIWYDAEHEESYYTDKPLNTSIDVFPTMVYNGWTFIGWTANQQYNDLIGEENLDDENSATNDPADLVSTIYSNEAGWAYKLTSNVTMYPVFTKFEDNEPFDMVNGGDYYIYYIADADITTSVDKYGVANRIYAGAWESGGTSDSYGATQSCSNATLFTFTKQSNDKWTIYDNTNRKYLCAGATDNNLALNATAATNGEWTITVHNGNQVNAVSKDGYTLSALSQNAVNGTFKNYATSNFNNNSGYYHRVYLGSCTERVYSSNPSNKPIIQLSGDVYVTATNARGVMATSTLKVSARKLNANEQVNITSNSNDVYFSADRTVNFVKANKPTNTLTITASPSGVIEQDIYVHYKPSAEGNGTPASVVVSANLATPNPSVTDDQTIHVRNLPAKFVIATKVGATWYALPADMSSATNPLGVVIEVDETTMTTIAPNTTTYTLWPVKTTATEYDRYTNVTGAAYGDRVRFAAVNNNKGLWANNSKTDLTINNDMVIDQASDGQTGSDLANNSYYEWKVTTTVVDGHWQYTLQTDQTQNQNYLRYWAGASGAPKWGTYASGNDKLYFLPVTETKPFDYKVVEWYPTKVLIQTEAAITNPIVKIGGVLVDNVTCTNKGGKLYEISGLPLVNNPTKVLTLSYTADEVTYTNSKVVPIILSRETKSISGEPFVALTKEVYNYADLVVRDGATLTIDGGTHAENTFFNVTIYPTSKISVPDGKKLTVHSLTFFGGIDEIYNGSTYDLYKYGVPELSLKGTLYKSIAKMDYVMRVDLDQMYSLTVPYDVQLADIKYWDGSDIALGSALYVSAYDGEARANQSKKTWIYETDFNPATLKAGVGYTISAELQASVGNEYSILRMPMVSNVENDDTETAKTVAVTAHGIGANVTDNHKGWNLVGNPYMTTIQGADDADLVLGYLEETGTGPWKWVDDGIRYVTIPSDDGTYYWQQKFTTAELPPFKNFFVQIGTTGELQFGLGTRQSMPARSTQAAIEKEVEFEILMSNDARQDNTGLLISEEYSPAYEINADLEKMTGSMSVYTIFGGYKLAYNALSPINASEWIPVGYIAPAAGEYTFRLDDVEKIVEQVEHVYVIDYDANNIVDLMDEEYKFTTDKEQNDNRFAINVVLIQDKDNTTTGLDIINGNNTAPIKFIYHDKIYIKSGEVIYDGTGKQVTNINK